MADLKDLKGALVFAMKFEAAQQATRKDRHPIRAVNESDTSNSSVERLERQMRSFMNRVESLMSQKADGKKTLKCWTCGREGHLQRSCRARQGAETNSASQKEVSENQLMAISWGGGCQILESPIFKCVKFRQRVPTSTRTNYVPYTKKSLYSKIEHRTESIRQVTANENITIPPRTEIIVPGYIGNDVSFNSGLIGSAENKANGLLIASTLVDHSRKTIPKSSAERLFQEFEDVFSRNSSDIGHTTVTQHRIDTADHPPIKQHPRRLPFAKQEEVGTLLREMQENDIIEPSSSPWASPIVLVRKKDGSTRFCVDYRKLNDVTKKDSYPLPRIDDTLDTLSGHKWFSTLDLKSGYWQVEIHPEDREKTAFTSGQGLWQFKVMPFGLCNAPATFERLMETVLKGLTFEACLIYLDDVIIGGRTFEEHLQKYPEEGVRTDPEKVSAVKNWKRPENLRELRSFLGLCTYYRKFVKGFSNIARPLHKLTESKQKFQWTKECEDSFLQLKEALTSSPILIYPQPDKPFILDTDASNESVGAVLSQEIDGQNES
ncbi:retrovirus-related Pol polyprotein from transposon 17.6 [Trichonephila clavipes]|uniref:RNA-directed DNA polymerase n=1 Tax=Trichonephila clavipes TaxID=2585209 RepID=A0A8X6VXB1_TRICX|nr:retrovirus-related Pol polyprotein from transposon 17.6 [Trichonephila clavipes]